MRLNASNSVLLGSLIVLAIVTVGSKLAAGPIDDGRGGNRSQIDAQLAKSLKAQGFFVQVSPQVMQTSIILAQRGDCRLSVRDAREGSSIGPLYARDAKDIGPVRYYYRGQAFDAPPERAMWIDHFENKLILSLGLDRRVPIAVALATSAGCHGQQFGLADVRIAPAG